MKIKNVTIVSLIVFFVAFNLYAEDGPLSLTLDHIDENITEIWPGHHYAVEPFDVLHLLSGGSSRSSRITSILFRNDNKTGENGGTYYTAGRIGMLRSDRGAGYSDFSFALREGGQMNEVMRLTGNGNIGIGTYNPTNKLHINSSSDGYGSPMTSGNSENGIVRIGAKPTSGIALDSGVNGSGPAYSWLQSRQYNDYSLNFNLALNPNGGNVGIGTTNPSSLLYIEGIDNAPDTSGTAVDSNLRLGIKTGNLVLDFGTVATNSSYNWIQSRNKSGYNLNRNLVLNPNGGNIGIGTIAPTLGKLHVYAGYSSSNDLDVLNLQNGGENGGILHFTNAFGDLARITATKKGGGSSANEGVLIFSTAFDSISSEKMRITSDGNIGIGTTNPQSKLAVAGTITAQEIKVTQTITANNITLNNTPWADYVFEDDYKLQPLSEIESFVKENKHLPEVPSAEEIKEDGLSMASMMEIQMKKIEELTLHLIEQNKMMTEQNKQKSKQNEIIATQNKKIEEMQNQLISLINN